MPDESPVDENVNDNQTNGGQLDAENPRALTQEELLAEVTKLRKEAAGRRVNNKKEREATAAQLKEYDDWKKSQLSEVDRLKAEKAELEATAAALLREKLQIQVAKKVNLDPDLATLITGESEEEMLAVAKLLAAKTGAPAATATSMLAGNRGRPVGMGQEESESEWFRKQFSSR